MNKRERFGIAFKYLRNNGLAHTQRDLAKKTGKCPSSISKAFKGDEKILTIGFLKDFNKAYGNMFSLEWLLYGEGNMLAGVAGTTITRNVVSGDVNNSIVGDFNTVGGLSPNKYGDSPLTERNWCPVVPRSMAKMPDFDIMGHISKQLTGGNVEKLYSGTAAIDVWHYIDDNDLYPFYQKGDCLGLKAYDIGDHRIKTGDVYVVDTKRDGMITRRLRLDSNGDIVTYTYNEADPQEFVIPKDDVIRIYKKVLMFRY